MTVEHAQRTLELWKITEAWAKGRIFGNIVGAPEPESLGQMVDVTHLAILVPGLRQVFERPSPLLGYLR